MSANGSGPRSPKPYSSTAYEEYEPASPEESRRLSYEVLEVLGAAKAAGLGHLPNAGPGVCEDCERPANVRLTYGRFNVCRGCAGSRRTARTWAAGRSDPFRIGTPLRTPPHRSRMRATRRGSTRPPARRTRRSRATGAPVPAGTSRGRRSARLTRRPRLLSFPPTWSFPVTAIGPPATARTARRSRSSSASDDRGSGGTGDERRRHE